MTQTTGSDRGRVLVVDDDRDMQLAIGTRLRFRGYETLIADDGECAISVAREDHPDLILLDLGLPGTDGFSVLERLKSSPELSRIPVIVLSASDAVTHAQRVLDAGAFAYVEKTTHSDELLRTISSALAS